MVRDNIRNGLTITLNGNFNLLITAAIANIMKSILPVEPIECPKNVRDPEKLITNILEMFLFLRYCAK